MTNTPFDRREFARRLAAGAAGVGIGSTALADDPEPRSKPNDDPPADDLPPEFGPPPPFVLLVEFIHQKYPDERLTVDLLERIEGDVRAQIARGDRLARHPFTNADEPAPVFAAYRAEG